MSTLPAGSGSFYLLPPASECVAAEHVMQQVVRHFHRRRSVCILNRILYKQSTASVWYGMV